MKPICVCDCCGLCCQRLIVEADAIDVLRESRIAIERPLGHRAASLSLLDACWIVAVPGRPCPFLTPQRRCGIYPTRPDGCVAFAAGSPKCQRLRQECGLPALAALAVVDPTLAEIHTALLDTQDPGAEPIESSGVQSSLV